MTEATQTLMNRPDDPSEIISIQNIHAAVGMDTSYMSMIEGTDGVILVDSGASPQHAAEAMSRLREITTKPLKAVIFTHSHPDHTGGLPGVFGFEEERDPSFSAKDVPIWARDNFGSEFGLEKLLPQIFAIRGARQFGVGLPADLHFPPLGPRTLPTPSRVWPVAQGPFPPTNTFSDEMINLDVAGVHLELYAAPGETSDHLFIWMPSTHAIFAGDNIYGSFPNLYAVRGSGYRDVATWAASVKKIHDKAPDYLFMGHSAPRMSKEESKEWLSCYYEAIQYVFDATIEGMNKGLTAEDLAASIHLPEHLAKKEFLTQYYGNVSYAVRSIFNGHLGWFDGDARKLSPLSPKDEAEHMVEMGGGADAVMQRAAKAFAEDDAAWAAQLASYVMKTDPSRKDARALLADAVHALGEATLSTSGRNYMLSSAQELRES